jgi:hypothetical protein
VSGLAVVEGAGAAFGRRAVVGVLIANALVVVLVDPTIVVSTGSRVSGPAGTEVVSNSATDEAVTVVAVSWESTARPVDGRTARATAMTPMTPTTESATVTSTRRTWSGRGDEPGVGEANARSRRVGHGS